MTKYGVQGDQRVTRSEGPHCGDRLRSTHRATRASVLLVVVVAAGANAASILIADPAGDVSVRFAGATTPESQAFQDVDVVQLEVTELETDVRFRLESVAVPDDPRFEAFVNFTFGDLPYQLHADDRDAPRAYLLRPALGPVPLPVPMFRDGNNRIIDVSREQLIDAHGSAGLAGTELVVLGAYTTASVVLGDVRAIDIIEGGGRMVLELGDSTTKDVQLGSPVPTRVSNGEATVYNYELNVQNRLDKAAQVSLTALDVPNMWNVRFPLEIVSLEPHEQRTVPVLVAVPFNHQHGSYESFEVQARYLGETEILSTATLGVRFTEVPQPAGHHSRLWFHSASSDASPNPDGPLYFSTQEEDAVDQRVAVRGMCFVKAPNVVYEWRARLSTPLDVGLDFDLNRTVDLQIPLETNRNMADARMQVTLFIRNFAAAAADVELDLAAGVTEVDVPMRLAPGADLMKAYPNGAMEVRTVVSVQDPLLYGCNVDGIDWIPGATADLPLFEYHDPVPVTITNVLTAIDVADLVAPGSRLVIEHHIDATPETTFEMRAFGHGSQAARLSRDTIKTDAAGHASFLVQIDVPREAADGDVFDIIVEASSPRAVGLHRTAFSISAGSAMVNHEGIPDGGQDAPALGALIVMGLLVLTAMVRRR